MTKSTYLPNFDKSNSFWNPTNSSETINILEVNGLESTKGIAQLWIIRRIEYTMLVINQYPSFKVKLYLSNNDRTTLCLMHKQ